MSRHRPDSAGAGSASDKDVLLSPSSQPAPTSPSQATLVIQTSPKDSALSEKYKKLKRRFFELEEETSTELQRSSERNVRMREERNMLLDRIIELEAQSQGQSEANGSPTSPSFPRTLITARARTSFVENLRQAFVEDDTDDNAEPVSPSRHLRAQARKKADDERGEQEAKRPIRKTRASHPPSSSSKAKEGTTAVHSLATASSTCILEEAYQISDGLSDAASLGREAPASSPEGQSIPLVGSPGPSIPPIQLETPRQSPVLKSVDLSHADTVNVDRQTNQASPNRMTSHDDAITDVAMADGTSHEASGHDVRLPIDETNAEAVASHHTSLNVATQVAPDKEKSVDKTNNIPTTPLVKIDGKKTPTRSSKAKGGKKSSSVRVEAEQSGSPQASRRSARLARNADVPTENEVETLPIVPVINTQPPKSSTNTSSVNPGPLRIEHQNSVHTHARVSSPSQDSETHFSVSASPPPPSEPITETASPTTTRHALDLIDPLLKHAGVATSSYLAGTFQPSEPTPVSPSPSMDSNNIVRVATAVIAAQNAARATQLGPTTLGPESASPGTSSVQTQGANSDAIGAASTESGLAGPSPITNNPYLALSAVKPGGSPVNMPPMMPPMNPYSLYYPAPSSAIPPYPYANPYYYMSPMAGPSNVYSPPPSTDSPSPNAPRSPSDTQRQTKPKRLKAHTVTSKQFSIPMVPRDKNGKPMLPLNVGIMTVINLGTVCMREHFHTERYIFPVGYEVTRRYMSTVDPNHDVVYHCTILDGGDGPKFQIIPADAPDRPVIAGTATGAWSAIVKQANTIRNRQHSNSVSGPDFFGLGQNTIKHLIQQLPNADRLRDYVWQHFVEGGPLGGRHAAVIPALPDEYENLLPIGALQYHEKQRNVPSSDSSRGLSYYPQHIIQQAQQERQQQEQQRPSQQQ